MFTNSQKSSESDHTFNFNYQLELKTHKSKTSEFNQKLQFNDFPDLNQSNNSRTITTNKKQADSFLLISNPSNRSERTNPVSSWLNYPNMGNSICEDTQKSPKFAQTYQQSQLQIRLQKKIAQALQSQKQNNLPSLKKTESNKYQQIYNVTENQYMKECENKIAYLKYQNNCLDYEASQIQKQIEELSSMQLNQEIYKQLKQLLNETQQINEQILLQQKIAKTLANHKDQVNNKLCSIYEQIDLLKFERPDKPRDEALAVLSNINTLKQQFQSLRKQNQANLHPNFIDSDRPLSILPSIEVRFTECPQNQHKQNNSQHQIFKDFKLQIKQAAQKCGDPNFIKNIKYSIIKDQWKIYENSELSINYDCRYYPNMHVLIGNKSKLPLLDLEIKQNQIQMLSGQTFLPNKVYKHEMRVTSFMKPFSKLKISYLVEDSQQIVELFLPTMPLKFGEFLPITPEQFEKQYLEHQNKLEIIRSRAPNQLDLQFIPQKNILVVSHLLPNILWDGSACKGIFQLWNGKEGALLTITQKGLTFTTQLINNIPFLLGSIQFLISSI